MTKRELVTINYLRQVADQLAEFGGDIAAWLAREGLEEKALSDASVNIPMETFGALVRDAVAQSGESGFGLFAGRRLIPNTHGVVGMATSASASIREAMEIVERFVALRTQVVSIRTRLRGDRLEVLFDVAQELGAGGPPVLEVAMLAVKNIADEKVLQGSLCESVCFSAPEPPHAALAQDVFGCPVNYGSPWSGLSFPLAAAEQLVSRRDALVLGDALEICNRKLKELRLDDTATARLERLLLERKPAFPPMHVCARLLGMASRTLHRRLVEEGTSYNEVLGSIRHRIALECLKGERMTVKEVAYLLGYNDVANFRRAFKRWEGQAPGQLDR